MPNLKHHWNFTASSCISYCLLKTLNLLNFDRHSVALWRQQGQESCHWNYVLFLFSFFLVSNVKWSLEIWAFVILRCISFPSSFERIILGRGLYILVPSAFTHLVLVRLYLGCCCEKAEFRWKQTSYLRWLLLQTLNYLLILFLRQKNKQYKVHLSELEYFSLLHIPG